ncbi:MAG: transcription-repair coupling factor [Rhodospirillales bacterium]|jgi:transcription-repair coupling factor (superfamily II helicase)|nr:transcription-repair coupling factor [Rhodospirillaceae bacterium]MDP6427546.1 transcription-repair coupling factor [Rhodospirillales bacterium]MDP6643183.1 transcription-repair coupling factor [Rhodospirillales bacterium]MDP6841517.1 transcription-repair coupling factor [Rhodospirillales bacterium]
MNFIKKGERTLLAGAPEGYDGAILADLARDTGCILFIARDDRRMTAVADAIAFFGDDVDCIAVPAWDCLPYDRVSPRADILARRVDALTTLAEHLETGAAGPTIILTTVAAILQKLPPPSAFAGARFGVSLTSGIGRSAITDYLEKHNFQRTETVMEPGEYALRGGILDLFPPGRETPLRLDFFGEELDSIRAFDPVTQLTTGDVDGFDMEPVGEITLDEDAISRFRTGYRALFGAASSQDILYESVSAGRRYQGMEHWLPLFHEELGTLFDYLPGTDLVFDHEFEDARRARWDLISDCFDARQSTSARGLAILDTPYHPLPADRLYLTDDDWQRAIGGRSILTLQPFAAPGDAAGIEDAGGKPGRDFAEVRARPGENVFDALRLYMDEVVDAGGKVILAAVSEGSRQRLLKIAAEHGISAAPATEPWRILASDARHNIWAVVLDIQHGFVAPGFTLIAEQDVLGDRVGAPKARRMRPENFIAEASSLNLGDLVVHEDHGIGRFHELITLDVAGASHDCLQVEYERGDKLFVPVENIDVLSRYGDDEGGIKLDSLGGAGWQARKARMKERIREMADQLIQVAAARELSPGEVISPEPAPYEEFSAAFPYQETEDQTRAIEDVLADLEKGRPMDRLICGDVGFGKTEVALRAAFVTAMEGKQAAVVVPTTLLARQHYQLFVERFKEFPVRVAQISRLVPAAVVKTVKEELKSGALDIVIGTHALLAKDVSFGRLGLLIVDEEQHFGVAHKEKLKALKSNMHVLTMTATPIPRTLQLALTGVREMSLITTPPVDRLAVRTFVLPQDPVVIMEAINRERFRGGQVFYVTPRIVDIPRLQAFLAELVPDIKLAVAHGQMPASKLEKVIGEFYDGAHDLLLSTNIIESGLDLPSVNTIIIHRADMFGLAQLYQLRGRIGRSKLRGYAYLTLPGDRRLTAAAQRRLEVMQALDSLGAGFMLASHDLDIRGAGNLLGEEQSGHIREVGIELYQQMLEDAVAEARAAGGGVPADTGQYSPSIDVGIPVLIPADYVPDLGIRLSLYRRIANLTGRAEIEAFAVELIDRFGSLPDEVENLLQTVAIKRLCLEAGVERLEAGSKGAVVSFHKDHFENVEGLVKFITGQAGTARLRPDQKLVFSRSWEASSDRMDGVRYLLGELSALAN